MRNAISCCRVGTSCYSRSCSLLIFEYGSVVIVCARYVPLFGLIRESWITFEYLSVRYFCVFFFILFQIVLWSYDSIIRCSHWYCTILYEGSRLMLYRLLLVPAAVHSAATEFSIHWLLLDIFHQIYLNITKSHTVFILSTLYYSSCIVYVLCVCEFFVLMKHTQLCSCSSNCFATYGVPVDDFSSDTYQDSMSCFRYHLFRFCIQLRKLYVLVHMIRKEQMVIGCQHIVQCIHTHILKDYDDD